MGILKSIYENIEVYLILNKGVLIELFLITNLVLIGFVALRMIGVKTTFKLNPKNYIFWIVGSIVTFIILNYLRILTNNHQSIVLVSFTWSKLFINLHKKLDSDAHKPILEFNKLKEFVTDK